MTWLAITPNTIVDPEGNAAFRALLQSHRLALLDFRELVRRSGDEQEIEESMRLLDAA